MAPGAGLDEREQLVRALPVEPQRIVLPRPLESRDGRQLAQRVRDVGVPIRPGALGDDEPRGQPLAERRADRKDGVCRDVPTRGDRREPVRREKRSSDPIEVRSGQRLRALDDVGADRGEHTAGHAGGLRDIVSELGELTSLRDGCQELPVALQAGRQLSAADGAQGGQHVFAERAERHLHRDLDQHQSVTLASVHDVLGHPAQLCRPRGERHHAGLRQGRDKRLAVGRLCAPDEPTDDQLAADEVTTRLSELGRKHPPHRAVQLFVLAAEQPQVQVRLGQQLAQDHPTPSNAH